MTRRDALLLLLLGAVWGAVYPLTSLALRELDPPSVVVARTTLAALLLVPLAIHGRLLAWFRVRPARLLVAALLQATIPLLLLTIGQQHVAAGLAGILVGTQPVWATALTVAVDRSVHPRELLGILAGLIGVVLLFLQDLDNVGTGLWGGALLLGAAGCYGTGTVYIQHRLADVPPLATATAAMAISAVALAPLVITAAAPRLDAVTIGWLLALGIGGTGAALVLFYGLIQRIGAVRANLAAYLAPSFAVAYDAAFLHGRITATVLGGLVLVTVGSLLTGIPSQADHADRPST